MIRALLLGLLLPLFCTAQHPPYDQGMNINDYYNGDWSSHSFTSTKCKTNYTGEHQLRNLPGIVGWPYKILSYKIEAVSFPFVPNVCRTNANQGDRTLTIAGDGDFASGTSDEWDLTQYSEGKIPNPLLREFEETLLNNGSVLCHVNSSPSDVASILFKEVAFMNGNSVFASNNIIYPHTPLKYTVYGNKMDNNGNPMLPENFSFSFVLDHTRGPMGCYPFTYNGSGTGNPQDYDVLITMNLQNFEVNSTGNYNFRFLDNDNTNVDLTYPNPYPNGQFADQLPTFSIRNSDNTQVVGWDNGNYGNDFGGEKHTYIIDQIIDLTHINPEERVIYNPSSVLIDLRDCAGNPRSTVDNRLVFPGCYTFRSIKAKYPEIEYNGSQVTNAQYFLDHLTPENGGPFDDFRDVPYESDQGPGNPYSASVYRIASGSKLELKNGVTIYDVTFEVEQGAELIYDQKNVYGRYRIVNLTSSGSSGTVLTVNNGRKEGRPSLGTLPIGTPLVVKLPSELEMNNGVTSFDITGGYLCRAKNIRAGEWIPNATASVAQDAYSRFYAFNKVDLLPGFEAVTGAEFEAKIVSPTWGCITDDLISVGQNPTAPGGLDPAPGKRHMPEMLPLKTDEKSEAAIVIFPNPVAHQLHIRSEADILSIGLKDISGKKLDVFYPSSPTHTIDVSGLNGGIYLFEVETEAHTIIKKVVVEK